jgi:hypothetical protein
LAKIIEGGTKVGIGIIIQEYGPAILGAFAVILMIAIIAIICATNGPAYHAIMNVLNAILEKAGIPTVS